MHYQSRLKLILSKINDPLLLILYKWLIEDERYECASEVKEEIERRGLGKY